MMEKRTTSFKLGFLFFSYRLTGGHTGHSEYYITVTQLYSTYRIYYSDVHKLMKRRKASITVILKKNTPDGTWLKLSENQMLFWRLLVINMNRSCTNTHRSTFTQLIFLQLNIILLLMNFLLLLTLWLQLSSSSLDFRLSALEQQCTARLD